LNWHESQHGARLAAEAGHCSGQDVNLLQFKPMVGETHWVSLGDHFACLPGQPLWVLYESPELIYQGLDDSPARITDLALIRVRVDQLTRVSSAGGLATATVNTVMTVDDLIALPYASGDASSNIWTNLQITERPSLKVQNDLLYLDARDDGMGGWAVFRNFGTTTDLLMISEYGHHSSHLWAGRLRIREGATWFGPPIALIRAIEHTM
jgi:hypothetical protein